MNTFNPQNELNSMLGKHTGLIEKRLVEIECNSITGFPRVKCQLHYLAFRDGLPTLDEFVDYLKWQMVPYCIPRRDRVQTEKKIEDCDDPSDKERIRLSQREKAISLFVKGQELEKKAGEPGELILFGLLETILKAPQIISKMYLKTSTQMPVHGSDGIHAAIDSDGKTLILYFGESKLHAKVSNGLTSVFESIRKFTRDNEQEQREIDIIRDHTQLGDDKQELKAALLEYLDPYAENDSSNFRPNVFSCFLGFDFDA